MQVHARRSHDSRDLLGRVAGEGDGRAAAGEDNGRGNLRGEVEAGRECEDALLGQDGRLRLGRVGVDEGEEGEGEAEEGSEGLRDEGGVEVSSRTLTGELGGTGCLRRRRRRRCRCRGDPGNGGSRRVRGAPPP